MIRGVNHITLSVRDLEESFTFYVDVLGFRPVVRWPKGAYLLAGDMWMALAQDENTRQGAQPEYSHIAFTVSPEDFDKFSLGIQRSGTLIWQENRSEGSSLYFLDPNGHKLEIHSSDLEARIRSLKEGSNKGVKFYPFQFSGAGKGN